MVHSEKDKITAVSKLRQGVPIFELCSTYNVCVRTIYRWAKEFPETDCKTALPSKQLESLQRRIDKLEKIITVLKAVNCTAHSPHKEKLTELEICVVLDLFSRKIVAHKISRKNSTQLVSSTLKQAIAERGVKAGLIFHSNRGTQYTSHSFCALLKSYSIVQSFSNTGKPHDNAVTESFFSTLKREELYRKDYPSEKRFKQAIDTYMTFYNTKRLHKTLKNLTPCQVEERFYISQKDAES